MKTLFVVTLIKGEAWDASKPMRSQEHWTEHAALMDRMAADGFIVLGGPLGDESKVLLVINAADESEIHSRFAQDPWIPGIRVMQSIQQWTIFLQAGEKP
jgi:hypothetical protein